ncbi:MAG: hypothetical protein Q4C56_01535 [Peptococcaceae bacterium]|nr:hypothetical protein [Peptococcaceae bacterium]
MTRAHAKISQPASQLSLSIFAAIISLTNLYRTHSVCDYSRAGASFLMETI